jgi:hypothetical protein
MPFAVMQTADEQNHLRNTQNTDPAKNKAAPEKYRTEPIKYI